MRSQTNSFDCGIHVIHNVYIALHSWQEAQRQLVRVYSEQPAYQTTGVKAVPLYRHSLRRLLSLPKIQFQWTIFMLKSGAGSSRAPPASLPQPFQLRHCGPQQGAAVRLGRPIYGRFGGRWRLDSVRARCLFSNIS